MDILYQKVDLWQCIAVAAITWAFVAFNNMNSKKSELESVGAKTVSFSDCAEVVPDISRAEDCSDGGAGSAPETEDAKEVNSSSSSTEVDSTSPTEQGKPESVPSPLKDVVDGEFKIDWIISRY